MIDTPDTNPIAKKPVAKKTATVKKPVKKQTYREQLQAGLAATNKLISGIKKSEADRKSAETTLKKVHAAETVERKADIQAMKVAMEEVAAAKSFLPKRTASPSGVGGEGATDEGTSEGGTTPVEPKDFDGTIATLEAALAPYGMSGILAQIRTIREKFPQIKSDDILTLIKFDPLYNAPYLKRFKGNATLIAQGKQPLGMDEYLSNEAAYDKVFTAFGVKQFSNRDSYANLIGGSVSPDEASTRVSLGYTRVLKDQDTLNTFRQYYPSLTTGDIIGAMLDPKTQLPALQHKVTAAEIGGAAAAQHFALTQASAENLGDVYGVTKDMAREGFGNIAQMEQFQKKLPGDISGAVTGEQMVGAQFKSDAEAILALRKVAGTRIAEYEAGGGLAATERGVVGAGIAGTAS